MVVVIVVMVVMVMVSVMAEEGKALRENYQENAAAEKLKNGTKNKVKIKWWS